MKPAWILFPLAAALCACGGGSGGAGAIVAPALVADFTADEPNPGPGTSAMTSGGSLGDRVTVEVRVSGVDGLRSIAFDIPFDEGALEFLGPTPGTALERSGQTPLYVAGTAGGILTVAVDLLGPGSVDIAAGQVLVGLGFRVREAGEYRLNFQAPVMRDGNLDPIVADWYGGVVSAE